MAGKKGRSGGARPGAGRKSKTEEIELIEQLSAYDDLWLEKVIEGVRAGDFKYIKLFAAYRYGNPVQYTHTAITTDEQNSVEQMTDEQLGDKLDRLMFHELMRPDSRYHKAIRNLYGIEKGKFLSWGDIPPRLETEKT